VSKIKIAILSTLILFLVGCKERCHIRHYRHIGKIESSRFVLGGFIKSSGYIVKVNSYEYPLYDHANPGDHLFFVARGAVGTYFEAHNYDSFLAEHESHNHNESEEGGGDG